VPGSVFVDFSARDSAWCVVIIELTCAFNYHVSFMESNQNNTDLMSVFHFKIPCCAIALTEGSGAPARVLFVDFRFQRKTIVGSFGPASF